VLGKTGCTLFAFPRRVLQLLGVPFLYPLKTYHAQELEIWLKDHPNRVVTHYQIIELFPTAYLKSAKSAVAEIGFRKTGVFPSNRNVFDERDPGRISE
jgi:hypothetical protein